MSLLPPPSFHLHRPPSPPTHPPDPQAAEFTGRGGTGDKFRLVNGNQSEEERAREEEAKRRRDEQRRALFTGIDIEEDEAINFGDGDALGFFGKVLKQISRFITRNYPLSSDIFTVEARYGSSVAAYFKFYRWM